MNLYKIPIFLSGISIILITPAIAATLPVSHVYVSAESGLSSMANGHVSPYQRRDKKDFGYRLSTGYLFNINNAFKLGPELGYGYFGEITYLNTTGLVAHFESAGWDVLANLKYHSFYDINLYLKGGVTAIYQHYDVVGPNVTRGGFYQRKFSPTLVAAGSYSLTKNTEVGLSYTRIFSNSAPLSSKSVLTYTNVDEVSSVDAVMIDVIYNI